MGWLESPAASICVSPSKASSCPSQGTVWDLGPCWLPTGSAACCAVLLQELCLYTLGNLVVESEAVRKQLLPQGIIPVLASCIQVGEAAQPHFCSAVETFLAASPESPALLPAVSAGTDPSAGSCSHKPEGHLWAPLCSIFRAQITTLCSCPAESLLSSGCLVQSGAQGALSPLPGLAPAQLWFAGPNAQSSTIPAFGLSPVSVGRGTAQLWCGHRFLCPSWSPLCPLFSRHSGAVLLSGFDWHPGALALPGGISSVLFFDCSPRTRRCWKAWAMSSHSSSKPRKRPRRSSRESELLNPAPGWALGPGVVFVCWGHNAFPIPVTLIDQGRILPELWKF